MAIFFLLILWSICGFLAASVASEKGYSYASWFIAGLLFSVLALIAAAGLPDKKLRRYIRLIGEKQNAIQVEKETVKIINGSTTIKFLLPQDSEKEIIYQKLIDLIKKKGFKKKLDLLEIKSYDLEDSVLGGKEFVVSGKKDKYLIILSGKDKGDEIEWSGKI